MNSKKELFWILQKVVWTSAFSTAAALFGADAVSSTPITNPDDVDLGVGHHVITFVVEVKEHAKTNRQNDIDPAEGSTVFTRGDTFVVDGTIYPDGSIPRGHNVDPLPNAPKLGRYILRGVVTDEFDQFEKAVEGARDVDPIIFFSTELLVLRNGSILIDGPWPNAGFSVDRVVLGGTGRFRGAVGEVLEENIGEDTDGFCNLRMTFTIGNALRDAHDR